MAPPSVVNVTRPVGVPPPGALGLTVAVNVTTWAWIEGFGLLMSDVVVASWSTCCVVQSFLPEKLVSPEYVADTV